MNTLRIDIEETTETFTEETTVIRRGTFMF